MKILSVLIAVLLFVFASSPTMAGTQIYGEDSYKSVGGLICDNDGNPLTGLIVKYSPGMTVTESEVVDGKKQGWEITYVEGDLGSESYYNNGMLDGEKKHFTKDGRVRMIMTYEKGKLVKKEELLTVK